MGAESKDPEELSLAMLRQGVLSVLSTGNSELHSDAMRTNGTQLATERESSKPGTYGNGVLVGIP